MEAVKPIVKESILEIENRKVIRVTGVIKVFYISEKSAMIETCLGKVQLHGINLEVKKISIEQGVVDISGKFISCKYLTESDKISFKNWFKK